MNSPGGPRSEGVKLTKLYIFVLARVFKMALYSRNKVKSIGYW